MKRNMIIGLAAFAIVLLVGGAALADGYGWGGHMGYNGGYGRHMGYGGGYGHMGYGPNYNNPAMAEFNEQTAELRSQLYVKQAELDAALAAPEVDKDKVSSLLSEINDLQGQLSQARLEAELEYREANPNAGYGGGYGPGYCWR